MTRDSLRTPAACPAGCPTPPAFKAVLAVWRLTEGRVLDEPAYADLARQAAAALDTRHTALSDWLRSHNATVRPQLVNDRMGDPLGAALSVAASAAGDWCSVIEAHATDVADWCDGAAPECPSPLPLELLSQAAGRLVAAELMVAALAVEWPDLAKLEGIDL